MCVMIGCGGYPTTVKDNRLFFGPCAEYFQKKFYSYSQNSLFLVPRHSNPNLEEEWNGLQKYAFFYQKPLFCGFI